MRNKTNILNNSRGLSANGLPFAMLDLVLLSQRAENRFVGVHCGIMDQFAVGMGKENHAIFLNCQTLAYQHVPLPMEGYELVITNSNKRRGLADSKYNERRAECEKGLAIVQRYLPHVRALGDLAPEDWEGVKGCIEDETVRRRLQHVVKENARVLQAKAVLAENRIEEFGRLMQEEAVDEFMRKVENEYTKRMGLTPSFYVCHIGSGARELTEEGEKWPS
ncbi:hypothetical protein BSNK01_27900 [Bacillaceae bacterium]